jgi:hypothetical protein
MQGADADSLESYFYFRRKTLSMTDYAHDADKAKEAILQQVAADFLSSYSEFLNAASLIEQRPHPGMLHPDTNRSLAATRWLLTRAIEGLDRIEPPVRTPAGDPAPSDRKATKSLPPIVSRAIEDKILTRWPEAENLLCALPTQYGSTDLAPLLQQELCVCLEAVSHVDVHSTALLWQLQTALSRFTDAMVKGQFIAIGRLKAR